MKYVLIQIWEGSEDFILREMRRALQFQGHNIKVLSIAKDEDTLIDPAVIRAALKSFQPDRIIWIATTGFCYMDIWNEDFKDVPKIALFFDDPVRCIKDQRMENLMKHIATRSDFHIGIWDGYWRQQVKWLYGLNSHPIHLSADLEEFQPPEKILAPDKVVFVGMLHSHNAITEWFNKLSPPVQKLCHSIDAALTQLVGKSVRNLSNAPIPCAEKLIAQADVNRVMNQASHEDGSHLRWCVWALAKNAARIKMLRKTRRLLMFCEMKQLGHANEAEIRQLLQDDKKEIQIVDTSDWKPADVAKCYHYGRLQVQAIDPQSVQGGIPYRVFQAAASGRVLLTDVNPELVQAFEPKKEILSYSNDSTSFDDYGVNLTIFEFNTSQFDAIGQAARARFLKEHTWNHRIAEIESWINSNISIMVKP